MDSSPSVAQYIWGQGRTHNKWELFGYTPFTISSFNGLKEEKSEN